MNTCRELRPEPRPRSPNAAAWRANRTSGAARTPVLAAARPHPSGINPCRAGRKPSVPRRPPRDRRRRSPLRATAWSHRLDSRRRSPYAVAAQRGCGGVPGRAAQAPRWNSRPRAVYIGDPDGFLAQGKGCSSLESSTQSATCMDICSVYTARRSISHLRTHRPGTGYTPELVFTKRWAAEER
jgi:hypothetical protein